MRTRFFVLTAVLALMLRPEVASACANPLPVEPIFPVCDSQPDPDLAPEVVPLYRFNSAAYADHLYTTSEVEKEQLEAEGSYGFEKIEGYLYKCPQPGTIPLHRLWQCNKTDTFLTTRSDAATVYLPPAWEYGGIVGYVYPKNSDPELLPTPPGNIQANYGGLHRYYITNKGDHFYTRKDHEATQNGVPSDWNDEGIEAYIFTSELYTHWRVSEDKILDAGQETTIHGMTTVPFYRLPDPSDSSDQPGDLVWYYYDHDDSRTVVELELEEIAGYGANAVRVFAPTQSFETSKDTFDAAICGPVDPGDPSPRIDHFLDTARDQGLRVVLTFNKLAGYRELFLPEFCPGGSNSVACVNDYPGRKFVALTNDDMRQFMIDRAVNLITECDLGSRPEIGVFSFWNEMSTGPEVERRSYSPVRAWNEYLVDKYGTAQSAFNAWGYTPGSNCGEFEDEACPPDDVEFCSEPTQGPDWTKFALDYRRFADEVARNAFQDLADQIRPLVPYAILGTSTHANLKGDLDDQQNFCETHGHAFDPRVFQDMFDVIGINSYPWRSVRSPLDDISPADQPHADNFDKFEFMIDYARTNADGTQKFPVYIQETGYDTQCQIPDPMTGQCPYDSLHEDVLLETAERVRNAHANGALIFKSRDQWDVFGQGAEGPGFGIRRQDGSPRDAYFSVGLMMDDIAAGRDDILDSGLTVVVDPYSRVLFSQSLLEQFAAWQAAHQSGIVTITEPSTP